MLLFFGVLLFCSALLALVWAYEVNRRVPLPRWARVELIWEMLLATAIGVAMVGLLLLLKFALAFQGLASLDPLAVGGAVAVAAASVLLSALLLRPLRRLRVVEGGSGAPQRPAPAAGPARPAPRKAA